MYLFKTPSDHTGTCKCIRRFGGIYAYCRYFFIFFKINSFRNTIRASNSLYPYQQAPRLHNFFMLNSDEREIYPVHTCYFPTIVGILTFISKINTTFEWHKVRHFFICRYFRIYEKLKFRPWFSLA